MRHQLLDLEWNVMNYTIHNKGKYNYIQEGQGPILLLLHGLFGSTGNFTALIDAFRSNYTVITPILPIFELPPKQLSVHSLTAHIKDFILEHKLRDVHVVGNSLGGHLGLLLTLSSPDIVKTLTLTGSSGLFENALGNGFPRRQNYDFVKEVCGRTFHDPNVATKELVDEVFETVNTPRKGLNIIIAAKSAMRTNLEHELYQIKVPTLLIWGREDQITPLFVGEEFRKKIEDAELHVLDKCGHAPMMEKPKQFNRLLAAFLQNNA